MERLLEERMKALAIEYEVKYTEQDAIHTEVNRWSFPENSDGFELEIKLKEGQRRTFQFHYEDMECFLEFINNLPQTIREYFKSDACQPKHHACGQTWCRKV